MTTQMILFSITHLDLKPFDAAQQAYIMLNKSMPESMEGTPIGEASKNPAQFQFYRVTNAVFTALIAVIHVITIYK